LNYDLDGLKTVEARIGAGGALELITALPRFRLFRRHFLGFNLQRLQQRQCKASAEGKSKVSS